MLLLAAPLGARADVTAPPRAPGAERPELTANEMWTALQRDGRVRLYKIYFEVAKGTLKRESDPTLAEIARLLAAHPVPMRVDVHSDARGSAEFNRQLTQTRAEAIRDWLVAHGAQGGVFARGAGETEPIATNDTALTWAKSRRVELVLITIK